MIATLSCKATTGAVAVLLVVMPKAFLPFRSKKSYVVIDTKTSREELLKCKLQIIFLVS